jgi:hypothetical protein
VDVSVYLPSTFPSVIKSNFLSKIKWEPSMREYFRLYVVPSWRNVEVDDDDPYDEPDVPVLAEDFHRAFGIEPPVKMSCTKSSTGTNIEYISSSTAYNLLNSTRPAQTAAEPWDYWRPFEFVDHKCYWAPVEIWIRGDTTELSRPRTFWALQTKSEAIDCRKPELFTVLAERCY